MTKKKETKKDKEKMASQRTTARKKVKAKKFTLILDCIGPSADGNHRGLFRPGIEAFSIILWLNEATMSLDSKLHSAVALDQWMAKAVPQDEETAEQVFVFSSWQPVLWCRKAFWEWVDSPLVERPLEKGRFVTHSPVNLERLSAPVLDILLRLLQLLPGSVVSCYGSSTATLAFKMNFERIARVHGLGADDFEGRIQWLGNLHQEMHLRRIIGCTRKSTSVCRWVQQEPIRGSKGR